MDRRASERRSSRVSTKVQQTLGVRFSYLRSLPVDRGSDFDVVCEYVKSLTKENIGDRSLCSHLLADENTKHLVGPAEVFVSYAWKGGFGPTTDSLENQFQGKDPYIWMDFALLDQHVAASNDFDFTEWTQTFGESLLLINSAIIVLVPALNPIAPTRSWCCFEWARIKVLDIPFHVCTSPADENMMIAKMQQGDDYDFSKHLYNVNVRNSKASKLFDQTELVRLMEQIGITEINDIISESMKAWMLKIAERAAAAAPDDLSLSNVLQVKEDLRLALGNADAAADGLERWFELFRKLPEDQAGRDGSAYDLFDLSQFYFNTRQWSQLLTSIKHYHKLCEDVAATKQQQMSDFHYATSFWFLYKALTQLAENEETFTQQHDALSKLLEIESARLGNENEYALARKYVIMATFLNARSEGSKDLKKEAFQAVQTAFQICSKKSHIDGLACCFDVAPSFSEQLNFSDAEELFLRILDSGGLDAILERYKGGFYRQLGLHRQREDRMDEAEVYFKKALEIDLSATVPDQNQILADSYQLERYYMKVGILGRSLEISSKQLERSLSSQTNVASSFDNFAEILVAAKRMDEIERLGESLLEKFTADSEEKAAIYISLATFLSNKKVHQLDKAYEYYTTAIRVREALHGPESLPVAKSLSRRADCVLVPLGKFTEAVADQTKALTILERNLDRPDLHIALALSRLGRCQYVMGEKDQGLQLKKQSLVMLKRVQGPKGVEYLAEIETWASVISE